MGDTPTLMFGEKRRGKTFSCSSFTQLVLLLQRLVPGKNTKIQKEKSHVPNTDYYCVFSHHKHPLSTVCVHTANVLYLLCVFTTQVSSSSVSFDLLCVLTLQTSSSSVGFVPVVGSDAHQLHPAVMPGPMAAYFRPLAVQCCVSCDRAARTMLRAVDAEGQERGGPTLTVTRCCSGFLYHPRRLCFQCRRFVWQQDYAKTT